MKLDTETGNFPRVYFAVFALLAVVFVGAGALYYRELKESTRKEKQSELETIADLKIRQIANWRNERFSDALLISYDGIAASKIKEWFQHPEVSQDRIELQAWLASMANHGRYRRVYLIDEHGAVRLSVGKSSEELGKHVSSVAKEALKTRRVVFGDFEREEEEFGVHLDIFAPIFLARENHTLPVAVILLQVDPQEFFFPLVKSWPIPSGTSEVVLVRREADSIVFITETKDHKHPPLSLHLPMTQNALPSANAINGEEGIVEGVDYAGVPVLAVAKRIPDSPWSIVVKVSLEEMYAPLQEREVAIEIFVGALLVAAGSIIGLVWRHQRALFYRRRYELELEREALEEHYDYATKYANDAILMIDTEGRIVDVNDRAIAAYGYSRDEFRILTIEDIRRRNALPNISETMSMLGRENGLLYETTHRRKDGSDFPVEVSARAIRIGDELFYQSIVRDITDRKRAEEALRRSEERYRGLFEHMMEGFAYCRMIYENGEPRDFVYLAVNDKFETLTGLKNVVGRRVTDVIPGIRETDQKLFTIYSRVAHNGKPEKFEMLVEALNMWFSISVYSPEKDCFVAIFDVITERKLAENRLTVLNRLYNMLSQINQTIVHATERNELLDAVCDISVKLGGFKMAWIGILDRDAMKLMIGGQSGLDEVFLALANDSIRTLSIEHPIGKMLMTGRPYVCNDIEKDLNNWPWQREAVKKGYRSFAAFPLQTEGQLVGTFVVNSAQHSFFSDDEIRLLDEITMDISFAIENMEKENQRKQTEKALEESVFWMKESQKAGRIGSYVTDFTIGYWQSSEALDEIFGIDKEFERTVEAWTSLVHPEQREELVKYLEEIVARKSPFDKEYRIIRHDDHQERWVHGRGELVFDDKGTLLKMFGTIQEVTSHKKSEESILLHSRALEAAANAVVITDKEGKIISVNPSFSRYTGYSAEEVIGRNPKILNSGVQSQSFYRDLWNTILSGQVWVGEIVNKRKDGSLYDEEMTITPVENERGTPSHFIAIKQDISERKRLHLELVQAQKMESIGTLASGIAHDFNNILGIILGYAALITRDPETLTQSVESITAAVKRGADLVRQILAFARKADTIFGPLDLNSMVKEIVKMLRETFPKTIEISLIPGAEIPAIKADATQIHQAILNLCVNARDAMPVGGALSMKTDVIRGTELRKMFPEVTREFYTRLTVNDTGIGMDEKTRSQIFDPFFTTKGKTKGTGLGLSVVYGVMKEHHGFVKVESEPGKGSTFELFFPVLPEGENPILISHKEVQPIPGGRETILVVEDEEALIGMMKVLIEASGYQVITAMDGLKALEMYRSQKDKIDLVLSDLGLPKISGDNLFSELKKQNPSVKVILASGYMDASAKSEILKAGVKDFVQKPYSPDEVLRRIREVLDRA